MLTETGGSSSRPNAAEMAITEQFFRAYKFRTYSAGRFDADWRNSLAHLQAMWHLPPTGYLDGATREAMQAFYEFLGSDRDPDGPKVIGPTAPVPSAPPPSLGGGVTGGGGGGGGGGAPAHRAPRSMGEIRDYIASNFPAWLPFINHPELGHILMQAAMEERDAGWLQSQIQVTNWFKGHSEAQRNWEILGLTDPAEQRRLIAGRISSLGNLNGSFGLGLSATQLHKIATQSLELGWSDDQINDYLSRFVSMDDTRRSGLVSDVYDQAHALAGEYFVGVSDGKALDFARKIISGNLTAENLQGYFVDQAKATYKHLADQLDKGMSMREIFDPHRQEIARLLEVSPADVDFTKPEWQKVVTYTDPADGKVRMMNLHEAADLARHDKRWGDTDNAKQSMAETVFALGETFGAVKR